MDLIVLAVKAADVTTGARQALPMLGAATPVLTIQNGLGSAETVAGIVGDQRVAVGIASGFGAARVAPGHVHHNAMRAMRFGAYSSLPHATVESIARAWTDAGFDAAAVTDIAAMQWEKLICNVAYSAPCALTGMTVGQVMDDPEMGPISRAAATEAWAVARASGIAVDRHRPESRMSGPSARRCPTPNRRRCSTTRRAGSARSTSSTERCRGKGARRRRGAGQRDADRAGQGDRTALGHRRIALGAYPSEGDFAPDADAAAGPRDHSTARSPPPRTAG